MQVTRSFIFVAVGAIAWAHTAAEAESVGNTITYQGQLKQGGVPINGTVDLEFKVWDAAIDGDIIGRPAEFRRSRVSAVGFASRHQRTGSVQIGEVQARSWTVFGTSGSLQPSGRSASGRARHWRADQRQVGFSTTRA